MRPLPHGPAQAGWLDVASLTDPSRCPACTAPLAAQVCPACELDVAGPHGTALWDLSQQVVATLARRSELISTMRTPVGPTVPSRSPYAPRGTAGASPATAGRLSPRAAPPGPVTTRSAPPRLVPTRQVPSGSVPTTARTTAPSGPLAAPQRAPQTATAPAPARSGWAMQTILLVLGATLLAGAGLVFTVVAWGALPLFARGAVLTGVTTMMFAGARRAARANLRSSSEAIAALGSALVVLVSWVLWVAAGADGAVTMAGALLVAAVVLVPLGRALGLAMPSVAGAVALTLAPAALAPATTWPPAPAVLLAVSTALCVVGQHPWFSGGSARATLTNAPTTGAPALTTPVGLQHVRAALTVLAPIFLAVSALLAASGLLTGVTVQSILPLAVIALVSGLWAWVCAPAASGPAWSAVTGTSLAFLGATSAMALYGPQPGIALGWLIPAGTAVGVAATIGLLRALPRLNRAGVRASWVVLLVATILPAGMLVLAILSAVTATQIPNEASTRLAVVQILAGLAATAVAAPLLRLLGGKLFTVLAPLPIEPISIEPLRAPFPTHRPLAALPAYPLAGSPMPAMAPRERSAFSAHPMGVSVVASALLLLGLPLLTYGVVGAVAAWLALAALAAVASTRLPVPTAGPIPAPPLPAPRLAALVRTCAQALCIAALTVATLLSFSVAFGADASVSGVTGQALTAASFAVAGLALWAARSWSPVSAGGPTNRAVLLFGSLVITSVGFGIIVPLVVPATSLGWYAAPLPLLVVLVVLRARGHQGTTPVLADHLAALTAAATLLVPGLVVGTTIALTATRADIGQPLTSCVLALTLMAIATVLAWQLAFAPGAPAEPWLRATAGALVPMLAVAFLLSLHPLVLALSLPLTNLDWPLAALGLLGVLITVTGANRTPDDIARQASEAAVAALAVAITYAVSVHGDPARVAVALLISAVGTLAYAVAGGRPRWGWLALVLGVCASWAYLGALGSLGGTPFPPEAYTAPGGLAVAVVGGWQLVASLRTGRPLKRATGIVLAGLSVLVLPTVLLAPRSAGEARAVVVVVCVVGLWLTARLLTVSGRSQLRPLALPLTILALVGTTVGLGGRALALAGQVAADPIDHGFTTQRPLVALVLWSATAVVATAALAVHLARTRFPRTTPVGTGPLALVGDPRVWAVTVCTLLLTAPIAVLVAGDTFAPASGWVAGALVLVWGAAALLGTPPGAPRVRSPLEFALRAVPALVGAYAAALLGAAALAPSGVGGGRDVPILLLTCAGTFVAVVGVRAAQLTPSSSTWRTVSVGALATIIPTTTAMLAEPSGWWITAAMVVAAGWLVLGVTLRWKAPVACGGATLTGQVLVLAGPPALAVLFGFLGWMVLAVVGGALLALGLTFERQVTTARKVLRRYSELR